MPIAGNQYTLTLDSLMDFPFTVAAISHVTTSDLAVDGSTTPEIFEITPAGLNDTCKWDITRVMIHIQGLLGLSLGKPLLQIKSIPLLSINLHR